MIMPNIKYWESLQYRKLFSNIGKLILNIRIRLLNIGNVIHNTGIWILNKLENLLSILENGPILSTLKTADTFALKLHPRERVSSLLQQSHYNVDFMFWRGNMTSTFIYVQFDRQFDKKEHILSTLREN